MKLSEEDSKLYYELWLPLLDFVNEEYEIRKEAGRLAEASKLDLEVVKEVSDRLYEDTAVIDRYLERHDEIPQEHKEIIQSWKKHVRGTFVIERHLKKGSILISEDEKVYQVSGIISSLEEMFQYARLPQVVETTLLPFRNVIITDGLFISYDIFIGGNMARMFKEVYMTAKKSGEIIKYL